MRRAILIPMLGLLAAQACRKDADDPPAGGPSGGGGGSYPPPTTYVLEIPQGLPAMDVPAESALTEEGVALGRFLFYEERLSGDNSMSCGSCHAPSLAFSDGLALSPGIDGVVGTRSAMPLFNLGYSNHFFWDGRAGSLEAQAMEPVPNPVEMHEEWPEAVAKLQADPAYPPLFGAAFGTEQITPALVTRALAQFMRTLISGNSKFDRVRRGEDIFSSQEALGLLLFSQEGGPENEQIPLPGGGFVTGQGGADCFHCHGMDAGLFTDDQFHNNALDPEPFTDMGRGGVTGNIHDNGKFKVPSLRNIMLTAPYMHDGRFATIDEVIEHYNAGGHPSTTVDPFMKFTDPEITMELTPQKKEQIKAFLHTLTDHVFINDPRHQDPGAPVLPE